MNGRVIITNHEIIEIPDGVADIPIEDHLQAGSALPSSLRGARVYALRGRTYIAKPHPEDSTAACEVRESAK
ncbi:MAG: hypothetical protein AAFR49_10935 [Pseudomonadota bacterium]